MNDFLVAEAELENLKILVVDPDCLATEALKGILASRVRSLQIVADVAAGLQAWEEFRPDLTLVEFDLPGGDGLQLCERIFERDEDAALIVMAEEFMPEALHQVIELGVDAYLPKPLSPGPVLDAIRRSVRERFRVLDLKMANMVFLDASEGIVVTDESSQILAVNPAFAEITGYSADEAVGKRTNMLASGMHGPEFYRRMWQVLVTQGRWAGEVINRRKDGSCYPQWLSISTVERSGGRRCYIGLISDITERKREEERIRKMAHFDALTGLPNRVLFEDRLQRAILRAQRYKLSLAVLFIDLDHFKKINDSWGHGAGDEVLRVVAQRMTSVLRMSDTVSRRGGDEFVVMLDLHKHPEGVAKVCCKLIDEIGKPISWESAQLTVGASIGVAMYPDDASELDPLLAAADTALYEAKAAGRERFHLFHQEMQISAVSRLDLERLLRDGIEDWSYSLHYLPEINLRTGEIEHVEALLRFRHPRLGLMEAGRFLEIAEGIGIVSELGHMALQQAVGELAQLGDGVGLVVDLSAKQLQARDAVIRLLDILGAAGVLPRRITFECKESALNGQLQAIETLNQLAGHGCKFTLDDFGAGACSFALISQLPMSSIKIDRTFTQQIVVSNPMRELVGALIAFAHQLGVRAVAEGVESPEQLELLREMGCDAGQGYVFGMPGQLSDVMSCKTFFQ